eukprot:s1696_g5.t1
MRLEPEPSQLCLGDLPGKWCDDTNQLICQIKGNCIVWADGSGEQVVRCDGRVLLIEETMGQGAFCGREAPLGRRRLLAQGGDGLATSTTVPPGLGGFTERHSDSLSLDTANSVSYGNLAFRSMTWEELITCYDRGLVTATLAGSPCETFSEARYQPLEPANAEVPQGAGHHGGPRPLRSFARLLGLEGLTTEN